MPSKAVIHRQTRLFDDFFKIDEIQVSHEQLDGTMSAEQRRLVFERGDAVAVLLFNLDTRCVVLVRQFKVPTLIGRRRDVPSSSDGWITEAMAGMIDANETPEAAAIRETMEETGYQISNPRLIAKFFSSPGGTSERIFLYYADVRNADRTGRGGGIEDEDVEVVHMPLAQLQTELRKGAFEDPKLIIAAYWLADYLRSVNHLELTIAAAHQPSRTDAPAVHGPLPLSTAKYALKAHPDLFIGYKTGEIKYVKDVSLWVNSENQDMLMDRFLGKSISANIRHLGSIRDKEGNVTEDTIEEALRTAVGRRVRVEIGTVLETELGALRTTHGVRRIFHVATVKGIGFGEGVQARKPDLAPCVTNVLTRADASNQTLWRRFWKMESRDLILLPLLGAGDGGLGVRGGGRDGHSGGREVSSEQSADIDQGDLLHRLSVGGQGRL